MLSSITKKGEIESTGAPWVILIINDNISLVGLIRLPSMFQTSSQASKSKTLHFSILVIQDHIESIGKPILLRGDEVLLNGLLAQSA